MPTPALLPGPLPPFLLLLLFLCLALLPPAAVLDCSFTLAGLLLGVPVGARLIQGGVTTRCSWPAGNTPAQTAHMVLNVMQSSRVGFPAPSVCWPSSCRAGAQEELIDWASCSVSSFSRCVSTRSLRTSSLSSWPSQSLGVGTSCLLPYTQQPVETLDPIPLLVKSQILAELDGSGNRSWPATSTVYHNQHKPVVARVLVQLRLVVLQVATCTQASCSCDQQQAVSSSHPPVLRSAT